MDDLAALGDDVDNGGEYFELIGAHEGRLLRVGVDGGSGLHRGLVGVGAPLEFLLDLVDEGRMDVL